MNPLQKLAGQTAVYGLSSIAGRLINYLLVPVYTRVFLPAEFGIVTEMYAYVAFFAVLLTYGMETAFFRFVNSGHNTQKVYSTAIITLFSTSVLFVALISIFSQNIAEWLRYPSHSEYVVWFAWIVALDAFTLIPFARLRSDNKPLKFAAIRLLNIFVNVGMNIILIFGLPWLIRNNLLNEEFIPGVVVNGKVTVSAVFISNLIASLFTVLILLPEYLKVKLEWSKELLKKMLIYSLPLMIAGFAGIVNETVDRILIKYLLSADISMTQLGIYGACYKVSILMTIFIQAFRYAAEPFFFSNAKEKDAAHLYASVMNYFVITVSFIFLAIMMYIDVVILFVGEDFREGVNVIPILLLANLFLGIYYNLSIWYKLTNKTMFGAYLSIVGAFVTLVLNFILIPIMGYMGAAWATFACYTSMMVVSYFIGQKHYPVNYNLKKLFLYIGFAVGFYFISLLFNIQSQMLMYSVNTVFLLIFLLIVYLIEHRKLKI